MDETPVSATESAPIVLSQEETQLLIRAAESYRARLPSYLQSARRELDTVNALLLRLRALVG